MAIIWLSSLFLAIATISGGMLYRHDIFFGINRQEAVEHAVSDNLISYSNACANYLNKTTIAQFTTINSNNISAYLPSGFNELLNYNAISSLDQNQDKWLMISFNNSKLNNGVFINSLGEDVLRMVALTINNQTNIVNAGYYQQVYVGENDSCTLKSNISTISTDVANIFKTICNTSAGSFDKYIIMTKVGG